LASHSHCNSYERSLLPPASAKCTGEKARGQFSIFGAVEDNLRHNCARTITNTAIQAPSNILKRCYGIAMLLPLIVRFKRETP